MHLHGLSSCSTLTLLRFCHHLQYHNQLNYGNPISMNGCRNTKGAIQAKKKENIWSIDNDKAEKAALRKTKSRPRRKNERGKEKGRRNGKLKLNPDSRVLISGSMLMEIENVLQTQEPVIMPVWETFTSSISGIWNGVGAVFSPFTAEMEPISRNNKREQLYDRYTRSRIEKTSNSEVRIKTNFVGLNTLGEAESSVAGSGAALPAFDSFDLENSEVLEEESLVLEPDLVFFEDGSYSRGPIEIPLEESDESNYFLSPTMKFEQVLVKGCHKRLRIVHMIEFSEGGANIQILRVSVFEEQWVGPSTLDFPNEGNFEMKPFSQRKRVHPSELTGQWKVFEISATPIFTSETPEITSSPFVYLCMETLKRRSLPEGSYFGEEELSDMQEEVTVLWLPGGVTAYVDVDREGVLCIGVGWYSDEGVNLVMERDYGTDGKLMEVRWKTEVKRRWDEPVSM